MATIGRIAVAKIDSRELVAIRSSHPTDSVAV
jgi:hypothetical protein